MNAAGTNLRTRGFTLFEILVVLAILSIVATISVPSVVQAAKKSPMRQAMSDLILLAIGLVFFALAWGYAYACDRL